MNEYEIQPHDSFIDITPVFTDPFGAPVTLGTVRYRVSWEQVGGLYPGYQHTTQPVVLMGYPNSALPSQIQLRIAVSDAEAPQPTPLVEQPQGEAGYCG